MKGVTKLWIAEHPTQPDNREYRLTQPGEDGIFIDSYFHSEDGEWCQWKEYIVIPIEVD